MSESPAVPGSRIEKDLAGGGGLSLLPPNDVWESITKSNNSIRSFIFSQIFAERRPECDPSLCCYCQGELITTKSARVQRGRTLQIDSTPFSRCNCLVLLFASTAAAAPALLFTRVLLTCCFLLLSPFSPGAKRKQTTSVRLVDSLNPLRI